MSADTGSLRVVPRSHLGIPPTHAGDEVTRPHPDELLLGTKAGDMIVMHGECIHAGSCNASPHLRAYVSTFVARPPQDSGAQTSNSCFWAPRDVLCT